MPASKTYLRVVIPLPLNRVFDYLISDTLSAAQVQPGMRVKVPFGNTKKIGIIIEKTGSTNTPIAKLKKIECTLDRTPLIDSELLKLTLWAASYYNHSPGESVFSALPTSLRKGLPAAVANKLIWKISRHPENIESILSRAPAQMQIWNFLLQHPQGVDIDSLNRHKTNWRQPLKQLISKQLVTELSVADCPAQTDKTHYSLEPALTLNDAQAAGLETILKKSEQYHAFLVFGDTGSGKTELYLQFVEAITRQNQQVLLLVPEIGLTPQLIRHFRKRFQHRISVYHSGLSEKERLATWLDARSGKSLVILGTRSAVFLPIKNPGAIIIDEEHDLSFKQQEGFRYSARDVAVIRAKNLNIPIVLGSATPSLESLHNCDSDKYTMIRIKGRAGNAIKPVISLLDLRKEKLFHGLCEKLLTLIEAEIKNDKQTLLFLNRRGYSPTLMCHDCGWIADCDRCDARLTYHANDGSMRCHHCGTEKKLPVNCKDCNSTALHHYGYGTERIEKALAERFSDVGILRIDRDSTRRKNALQEKLGQIEDNQILIGTQILAKGHHFPNVTLVGIVDADQGLFGSDFRASERMSQLILQVAGRAGRAEHPGKVFIQTHCPDHPLMQMIVTQNYHNIANSLLEERKQTEFPPFSFLALMRAESTRANAPTDFLLHTIQLANKFNLRGIELFGPMPAPMEKRAGKFRAQLLVSAKSRQLLHQLLSTWTPAIDNSKISRTVRWSVDVDPQEIL